MLKLKMSPAWKYSSSMSRFKLFSTAVAGLVTLAAGLYLMSFTRANDDWVRVDGEISSYQINSNDKYESTVSYTVDNEIYEAKNSFSTNSVPIEGEVQPVAYDPAEPASGKVVKEGSSWVFATYLAIALGSYYIGLSIYSAIRMKLN